MLQRNAFRGSSTDKFSILWDIGKMAYQIPFLWMQAEKEVLSIFGINLIFYLNHIHYGLCLYDGHVDYHTSLHIGVSWCRHYSFHLLYLLYLFTLWCYHAFWSRDACLDYMESFVSSHNFKTVFPFPTNFVKWVV